MKKQILFAFVGILAPILAITQIKQLSVQEVDNEGKIPGRTYRIFAEMTNAKDQVFVVFGDSIHPLEIKSTKPFFQSKKGGAFSKNSNRKEAAENDSLRYDSWVTIGATDNYDNNVSVLNVNFDEFEKSGGPIRIKKDGAWFCIPTDQQAWAKEDKRLLLMQLTTTGEVDGKISVMGKTVSGTSYTAHDLTFQCGQKKKK